jgi:hypothetical protein
MIRAVLRNILVALAGMSAAVCFADDFLAVGTCPDGGTMSLVMTGPYKGRAFDLKKNDAFRIKYLELIGDPEHWSARFLGPAEENRKYVGSKGTPQVVFFTCQARNCAAANLYGVIDERTGAIGVMVTEQGKATLKGVWTEVGSSAIACAKDLDQQVTKRAEDSLKRGKK